MKLIGKLAALLALAAMASPEAAAQGRKELRINEVMIQNETSVIDDYGQRSAWIELINPTHAPVEISSIYITDDINNPRKYYVPRGDARTRLGKGQSVLFRADGNPDHGTFYLNFPLTPGQENFLAIFDADGINLIDSVTVPASLPANCSYARATDAGTTWEVRTDCCEAKAITPGGHNEIKGPNNKIENFKNMDENGFAMSIMAMSIVFSALLVLALCFIFLSSLNKRKAADAVAQPAAPAPQTAADTDTDAETAAAIAMALHQHLNAGVGNARLTINHNPASAWANKIYAMRQLPN